MESTEENLTQYSNFVNAMEYENGKFPDLLLTLAEVKNLQKENFRLRRAVDAARRYASASTASAHRDAHEEFMEALDELV